MFFRRVVVVVTIAVIAASFQVPADAGRYTPRPGVTYNSAVGSNARQNAIFDKIIRSIRSTPRGHDIRVMSWNIQSKTAVDALLRAQRRGVRVWVIMSRSNAGAIDNRSWERLEQRPAPGQCEPQGVSQKLGTTVQRVVPGTGPAPPIPSTSCSPVPDGHDTSSSTARPTSPRRRRTTSGTTSTPLSIGRSPTTSSCGVFQQMAKDRPVRSPYATLGQGGRSFPVLPWWAVRPRHGSAQQGQVPRGNQHEVAPHPDPHRP